MQTKTYLKQFLTASCFFILTNTLIISKNYAQDRVPNGGTLVETQIVSERVKLEQTALKIINFFERTANLRQVFPEVDIQKLIELKNHVNYSVTTNELRDRENTVRTCLNYIENEQKHIECNLAKLQTRTNARDLFVLVFHEMLGLQEVEISSIEHFDIMQSYPISARLAPYVAQTANYDLVYREINEEDTRVRTYQSETLGVNLTQFILNDQFQYEYDNPSNFYGLGSGLDVNTRKIVGIGYAQTRHRRSSRSHAREQAQSMAMLRCEAEHGRSCHITSENSVCERQVSSGQIQTGGPARACYEVNEFGVRQAFYGASRCRRRERRENIRDFFKLPPKKCWAYAVAEPRS